MDSLPRTSASDFRLRAWLVELSLNRLSANGKTVHFEPKLVKVLVCHSAHASGARPPIIPGASELVNRLHNLRRPGLCLPCGGTLAETISESVRSACLAGVLVRPGRRRQCSNRPEITLPNASHSCWQDEERFHHHDSF